ncbi:peroxiredoxin [Cesiribacter sp. SM1]|uniref:peroxiredoxin n=1 Tax=Cesiribacter sp. SM1 TaxID=2861196 RepID=UPI001CD76058|nr:peroxiredoxin [Cesiribacter sp. SM1]
MQIKLHTKAPNFTAASTAGSTFELDRDAAGQPLVLYFYPKDFTPVCTLEACEFKSTFDFFRNLNIKVLGVSKDSIETHLKFKEAYELPYDLLADPEGEVASLYDAYMPMIKFTKRVTYLLNEKHEVVYISNNIFEDKKGIEDMITSLKAHSLQNTSRQKLAFS